MAGYGEYCDADECRAEGEEECAFDALEQPEV